MHNEMNVIGVLAMIYLPILMAMFAVVVAIWYANQKDRRPHYLLRSAKKYSIGPLFGQSRESLLREAQRLRA